MKKLILITLLSVSSTHAAGFRCKAYCIDAYHQSADETQILFVDPLEVEAGLTKRQVFKILERLCKKTLPYSRPADSIAWRIDRERNETSIPRNDRRRGRIGYDRWVTSHSSGELGRNFETQSFQIRGEYSMYRTDQYGRSQLVNQCRKDEWFEYRIQYSTPDSACEADQDIEDGTAPYLGDLPILG